MTEWMDDTLCIAFYLEHRAAPRPPPDSCHEGIGSRSVVRTLAHPRAVALLFRDPRKRHRIR